MKTARNVYHNIYESEYKVYVSHNKNAYTFYLSSLTNYKKFLEKNKKETNTIEKMKRDFIYDDFIVKMLYHYRRIENRGFLVLRNGVALKWQQIKLKQII